MQRMQVEASRLQLSSHPEFDPYKAFCLLDTRAAGKIDAYDIVDFLRKNYVSADLKDGQDIIREYDSSSDNQLDFNEFC